MATIHQLATLWVSGVTRTDHSHAFSVGDLSAGGSTSEAVGFMMADGGATSTEEVATARMACETFETALQTAWRLTITATSSDRLRSALTQALKATNNEIFKFGVSEVPMRDRSSSMVAGIIHRGVLAFCNLGNVRLHLLRNGQFLRLTEDHTYAHALAQRGLLKSRMAEQDHPFSRMVTRRLGGKPEFDGGLFTIVLQPHDILLAVTDGVGPLHSSRQLNRSLGKMILDWLDRGIPKTDLFALVGYQLRYFLEEPSERRMDEGSALMIGYGEEDSARVVLPDSLRPHLTPPARQFGRLSEMMPDDAPLSPSN